MTWQDIHPNMFKGSTPRIFATKPDDPEAGRVFVWAQARWYERIESATDNGAIEFSPVADTEEDVRDMVRVDGGEMDEMDNDFAGTVKDEFLNQVPLYPEAEEESLSDREP